MIYLDTRAFIKLYLHEEGSDEVHGLVTAQHDPLPAWNVLELEFYNTLQRPVPHPASRSLDILHVAAARLIEAERFITADRRQATLAEGEGLPVD